jgi:hypothetical protein
MDSRPVCIKVILTVLLPAQKKKRLTTENPVISHITADNGISFKPRLVLSCIHHHRMTSYARFSITKAPAFSRAFLAFYFTSGAHEKNSLRLHTRSIKTLSTDFSL